MISLTVNIVMIITEMHHHHHHCLHLQPEPKYGRTPLMAAAMAAADETVSSLLSIGASPDKILSDGAHALRFAIQSTSSTTINLLAPVTQVNLGVALHHLARSKVKLVTGELRTLVERAAQDREAAIKGLAAAARFGSSAMIFLIAQHTTDHAIFEATKQEIWMDAVKSDSEATVSALLSLLPNPPLEAITLARERGVPWLVRLLVPDTKYEGTEEREALKNAVFTNTAQLLDQIPRDVEFTYNQKMDKLNPLLGNSLVPYTVLLQNLHLPKAHYQGMLPMCSPFCRQKQSCQHLRETIDLVHLIVDKLGERLKVFEGIKVSLIGSAREGTRIFAYDEVDMHLSLKENFKQFSFFDVNQYVLRRDPSRAANPEDCDKYFDENNFLKPDLYFHDFVVSVHSIISTLILPRKFTMLPLTTSFVACTRCMITGLNGLQVMRCWHKSDCQQHKMCRCEEPSKCGCLDECRCRDYASPSLTWSKVGVVLHLQWREKDGTLFTVDCDLNCPTWPTHTRYEGQPNDAQKYLRTEQPVGWLEELSKLENLTAASASHHLLTSKTWPVKFRLISRDMVLPSQVTTLTPPLSSPDSSFYEREHAGGEETRVVRPTQNSEILH